MFQPIHMPFTQLLLHNVSTFATETTRRNNKDCTSIDQLSTMTLNKPTYTQSSESFAGFGASDF
jgi:hypothetical protein